MSSPPRPRPRGDDDSAPGGKAAVSWVWRDPGTSPDQHAQRQAQLRQDWPELAAAIEQLVEETIVPHEWTTRTHADWFRPGAEYGPKHAVTNTTPNDKEEDA